MKDCPQKKRDDEKGSEGAMGTFSNLSEIAQDFYGNSEIFHGITEIYKDAQEDENQEYSGDSESEAPITPLNC